VSFVVPAFLTTKQNKKIQNPTIQFDMGDKAYWEHIYDTKQLDQVSWFREHLDNSLKMILQTGVAKYASVIDVGGGSSTLVDDLLDDGFTDLTVLDISGTALDASKERLGSRSTQVNWVEADITAAILPQDHFDVWHDRAVFHFLTNVEDRRKYVELAMRAIKPGGHIIVASFGLGGPEKCSGLDVVRYGPETMHDEFGNAFEFINCIDEIHHTPFGTTQKFIYCYCRKAV